MGLGIGEEFHKRHGADCINCHGQLIYSDGASRDRDLMGALFEPPRDPHELYTLQFRYREELLRRVIQDFTDIKQRLQSSARANKIAGYAPPPASEIKVLKDAQKRVQQCQAELDAVRKKLEDTPQAKRMAQARQRQAELALHNDRFRAEIDAIRI